MMKIKDLFTPLILRNKIFTGPKIEARQPGGVFSEGLDPDEFDEDPPPHEATDGHSEQPACADLRFADGFGKARASAGREELADLL